MAMASEEAKEVHELLAMLSHGSPSKRPQRPRFQSQSVGPGWDSTPHRNRPRALKGLVPTTDEPWMKSEYLNMDPELEFVTTHANLLNHGKLTPRSLAAFKAHATQKSESMGNRLQRLRRKKVQAEKRAKVEAIRAAERAEHARIAAELEALRRQIEQRLIQEAEVADSAIRAEVERLRREAEEAARAAAQAAEEERLRLEAEERERAEAEEKAAAAAALRKAEKQKEQQAKQKPTGGFGKPPPKSPPAKPVAPKPGGDAKKDQSQDKKGGEVKRKDAPAGAKGKASGGKAGKNKRNSKE